ncbi:methyl-accepting chemotaxis protein [Paenibacillus psychroresistens]|uniref:Methyl-accepting chemotaxis protein n=1 Tax=Paenibacillus psychroresistens TaxID=1778678 RepID=A0A6B8RRH2_9BACL|nr:methyl-accepting chemotaxis protein [Paenibacillus psychroresistens]QGQ98991.1 methyl-accepting chemotaxis protein [Paenibacillus psychroresistens]
MMKISTRLSLFIVCLLFLSISGISFISYKQSSNAIQTKIELYSEQIMNQVSQNLQLDLKHLENTMEDISSSEDIQDGLANYNAKPETQYVVDNKVRKILTHQVVLMPYIKSANIAIDSNTILGLGADYLEKSKYTSIVDMAKNNFTFNYSLINDPTGTPLISISKRFKSAINGAVLGTIVLTLAEEHIADIYRQIDIGKSADIFIMDEKGLIISSRDGAKIPVNQLLNEATLTEAVISHNEASKTTFTSALKGIDSLIAFSPIENSNWFVVASIPQAYLDAELNASAKTSIWLGLICLIVSAAIAYLISLSISSPSKKILYAMNEAKIGNLNIQLNERKKDEMGQIAASFNEMMINIRLLVKQATISTQCIIEQSQVMDLASGQMRETTGQFVTIISQITQGAIEQAEEASHSAASMNDLSEKMDLVGVNVETVSANVEKSKQISENTLDIVRVLNEKTITVNIASQRIVQDIQDFNEDMKHVKNVVEVISDIATQTNILSINASIEAARAGSAGKGFAVVAHEVKRLAEQSKKASVSINQMISQIQHKSELTVNSAIAASVIIEDQRKAVQATDESFQTISTEMNHISGYIRNVNQTVKEILAVKVRTLEAIEVIASVAEQTAATTEEASASTQEQLHSANELASLSQELGQTANRLSEAIFKFKID